MMHPTGSDGGTPVAGPDSRPRECVAFEDGLPDYLDGEVSPSQRAVMDAHADTCAACRSLRDDLAELRTEAAQLPLLSPIRDLWPGVSARIEAPPIVLRGGGAVPRWSAFVSAPWRLAAAAGVLMAVTAGVTWTFATQRAEGDAAGYAAAHTTDASRPGEPAAGTTLAGGAHTAVYSVAAAYDDEIGKLRQLVASRTPLMDSSTVQMLALNLQVIDDAIARLRGALDSLPSNALLSQQLVQAYDTKLQTLRQVAALPTE
jgi:anti-sigma factor RsiW